MWDKVIQCERNGVKNSPSFKVSVLQNCDNRNYAWSRKVGMCCHGVHDLAAAEAQFHIRCYDEFRKIPMIADQTSMVDDEAMQVIFYEMYSKRKLCTLTSIELHDIYAGHGGQLTRKQMFEKLVTHLADDVVVLSIEGCASIVGFREFVGKILKVSKVDVVDEEKEDAIVRTIITEAHQLKSNNKTYDLGDFTHAKTKENTSATLLRFVTKLISDGDITKTSLSQSQSLQYLINKTRNQTTLGLGIKLHHKFGSRDLIDTLNGHGYTVSYDEVLLSRKSAAKYVIDLQNIFLRLMMIGQRRKIKLEYLFSYELCSVPSSLIDEHGCLRKGNTSGLVKRLGVLQILPVPADIVIVDVSQLFYHIVWPHGGSPSDLIASIQGRLSHYPDGTEKVVVFNKYKDISAKDHERMRRAVEVFSNYDLSISSPVDKSKNWTLQMIALMVMMRQTSL